MLLRLDVAHAQDKAETSAVILEKPFHGEGMVHWNSADWAGTITTILSILILLIIFSTIIFRKKINPITANFLRFVSLSALPVFLFLFGSFATFEGSKKVEFCQSCHSAMNLYVSDLKEKGSETLASIHYNNRYIQEGQCYECHVNYGLFGTIQGKIVGLKHLYHWVTNSETANGKKQIKLYNAYQNELCLRCHAGSQRFIEVEDGVHLTNGKEMLEKDSSGAPVLSCLECHGPAHPLLEEVRGEDTAGQ